MRQENRLNVDVFRGTAFQNVLAKVDCDRFGDLALARAKSDMAAHSTGLVCCQRWRSIPASSLIYLFNP